MYKYCVDQGAENFKVPWKIFCEINLQYDLIIKRLFWGKNGAGKLPKSKYCAAIQILRETNFQLCNLQCFTYHINTVDCKAKNSKKENKEMK